MKRTIIQGKSIGQAVKRPTIPAALASIPKPIRHGPTLRSNTDASYLGQANDGNELDELLKEKTDKTHPRVALVARSNVGKSSLVNALLGTKLAIVSKMPGRTRFAHAYQAPGFVLVDLPGYGYARGANQEESEKLSGVVADIAFDPERTNLVLLLLDSRRMGFMPSDVEMMAALRQSSVKYNLVFTKIDALNKTDSEMIQQDFPKSWFTSSKRNVGIAELKKYLQSLKTPKVHAT